MSTTMTDATPPQERGREWGRGQKVLGWGLVLLCSLLTLSSWALASPSGSTPDANFHLSSIWCANGIDPSRCAEDVNNDDARVIPPLVSAEGTCFGFDGNKSGACLDKVPGVKEGLPEGTPSIGTVRGNWSGGYPPVFYRFMATFVTDDIGASVVTMRVAGGMVVVGLCVALAAALPRSRRALVGLPLLITSVPLGLNLFASTNPSSWTIAGVATLFPAAYVAFETTGRRRWALSVLALLAALMAAGSRTDGCLFVAMTAALVLILRVRELRENLVPAMAAVGCIAIGALFFLTSGLSTGLSGDLGTPTAPDLSTFELIVRNLSGLPVLWLGGFGYGIMGLLGWLDTPLPPLVNFSAIAVWATLMMNGLARPYFAKIVALVLVGLALVVYPIALLVQTKALVGAVVQPRYVLPLLALFTVIALMTPQGRRLTVSGGTCRFCVLGLSLANTIALHTQIRRYVTGLDVSGLDLNPGREWWWGAQVPAPTTVWIIGSLAFAGLAYLVLGQLRSADQVADTRRTSSSAIGNAEVAAGDGALST